MDRPVDGASSAVFRIVFGLCVLIGAIRYVAYGWVDLLYLQPTFFFTWPLLDWVRPLPGAWMYALYGAIGLFGVLVCIGLYTRVSAALLFLAFTWVELIDKTNYLNHYYLVSLVALLLVFLPTGRVWSVDAWRRPGPGTVPLWSVWTLRVQLGVVYFFAGVAKLEPSWLLEGQPLRIWLASKTDLPLVGPLLDDLWLALAMSWAGCLFDLSIFFLLAWRRTRLPAYAVVVFFHVATGLLFNIGMFPFIMVGLTLIFFEPDWPRRSAVPAPAARRPVPWLPLGAWLAFQLLFPMRHLAYPGDVRWGEEGWRFSWRVLLVEKRGFLKLHVTDPATGERWVFRPESLLTPRQLHQASSSPDMILHLAHHVAEEWRARGHPAVEVRADAWVSMNGGPSRRLVDPAVDLASRPRLTWLPWDFVLEPTVTAAADPDAYAIGQEGT